MSIELPTARAVELALEEKLADHGGTDEVMRLFVNGLAASTSGLKQ
jgi:hypothetical protein